MKKLIYNTLQCLFIGAFGLGFTSCLGNLDPIVYDKISPETFFKNESDAKAGVTAIYNPMSTTWGGLFNVDRTTMWGICLLNGDDLGMMRVESGVELENFTWVSTTGGATGKYTPLVQFVSRATLLMDYLKDTPMNEQKRNEFIAEVQCARGLYMFYLYDLYGTAGVVVDPAVLRNPDTQEPIERYSTSDFVALIAKDLREAAAVLPATYAAADFGRFTKGAALTILMKLYMQEKRWSDAESVGREIMALGIYGLQASYSSVFAVENEKNNEIIWAIPCLAQGGYGNFWMAEAAIPDYPFKNPNLQKWYVYNTPWRFMEKYEQGDDRLNSYIVEFTYVPAGQTEPVLATKDTYSLLKDGAIPIKYPEDPDQTGSQSGNDMVIFRYADILLSLAEAINEQNGPTAEAIGYVEQIRARAKLPNSIPAAATASKEAFRDFILDENGRELFCEGHRRRDLIRHGRLISEAHADGYFSAQEHMVLFPLPQDVIDESKGKIKQNPGY
jgi:hypothetical protein